MYKNPIHDLFSKYIPSDYLSNMPRTAKTSKESSSNTSVTGNSRAFSSIGNPPYREVVIPDPPSSRPLDERDQGDHIKKLYDVIQKRSTGLMKRSDIWSYNKWIR
jgi:hypothetical protein